MSCRSDPQGGLAGAPDQQSNPKPSVSIIIPARNEHGNIERLFRELPSIGADTQLVFVEGNSADGTWPEILRCAELYKEQWPRIATIQQDGHGKADAVWKGIAHATGDIILILDSDLTVHPSALTEFYQVLASGEAEFALGSRFIRRMESGAMRFLNQVGNQLFSFCWAPLMRARITDTLCGTKAFFRSDYEVVSKKYPDVFASDPFGDFAMLFIAAVRRLRVRELSIDYRARTYGTSNISRWVNGMELLVVYCRCLRHLWRNPS